MKNSANKIQYVSNITFFIIVLINALVLKYAFIHNPMWYWVVLITLPLLFLHIFFIRYKICNRISLKTLYK
jgi:uncharacterized membrane protein YhdT